MLPKRSVTIRRRRRLRPDPDAGLRHVRHARVSTPSMIRFGQMTEDELFVTADAAQAGVRIENTSDTDPLVILKHFGPGNPDAEADCAVDKKRVTTIDDAANTTSSRHSTTRCGRASSAKAPDSEPPIDLDTMLDLTATASVERRQVRRRRSVSVRSARRASTRPTTSSSGSPTNPRRDNSSSARWSRRCGRRPAAARRWATKTSAAVRHAGAEGLRDRQEAARHRHSQLRRRPHRFRREPAEWAKDPARQHEEDRGDLPRGLRRSPKATANGSRPKARSAGAACTAGSGMSSCSNRSAGPRRSASRRTWRTRCSSRWATTRPRTGSCPQRFDWTDTERARRGAAEDDAQALRPWTIDFHVAQNDATVKGSGSHDKTGRHCLPDDPNGKLDIVKHRRLLDARRRRQPDAGLRAHLLGRLHVPQRHDDAARNLERRSGDDDRGARRARLGLNRAKQRGKEELNIGMVGYGFMGRTHSNAFLQAPRFFDLPYQPVLKAVVRAQCRSRAGRSPTTGATSRPKPTGGRWSSARTST